MTVGAASFRAQNLLVGNEFTKVTGLGMGGVKVTPIGDRGAVYSGIQGDTMLEEKAVSAYTMTVELLQISPSIDLLIGLSDTVVFFPIKFVLGGAEISGFGLIQNEGEFSGADGASTRTITIAFAKSTGTLGSIGSILAV